MLHHVRNPLEHHVNDVGLAPPASSGLGPHRNRYRLPFVGRLGPRSRTPLPNPDPAEIPCQGEGGVVPLWVFAESGVHRTDQEVLDDVSAVEVEPVFGFRKYVVIERLCHLVADQRMPGSSPGYFSNEGPRKTPVVHRVRVDPSGFEGRSIDDGHDDDCPLHFGWIKLCLQPESSSGSVVLRPVDSSVHQQGGPVPGTVHDGEGNLMRTRRLFRNREIAPLLLSALYFEVLNLDRSRHASPPPLFLINAQRTRGPPEL